MKKNYSIVYFTFLAVRDDKTTLYKNLVNFSHNLQRKLEHLFSKTWIFMQEFSPPWLKYDSHTLFCLQKKLPMANFIGTISTPVVNNLTNSNQWQNSERTHWVRIFGEKSNLILFWESLYGEKSVQKVCYNSTGTCFIIFFPYQ